MKLSDFSLLKEDDKNYTIGHPQGKSMMVPKAGMSAKAQELVSKLKREQHFDEGGEVDLPVDVSPISGADQAPPAPTQDVDLNASSPEQTVDLNAQKAELNPQAPASEAAPAAAGANPLTVGLSDAPINQAVKDINAGTAAEGKAGKLAQTAMSDQNDIAAQQLDELDTRTQASDKAALGLSNAVSAGKIDPGRLWSHLSTGSKISASLGMILGGIGAGLTHGPNMALDMINKAIENDIDAQKNEQGKNMNLWKMNREALGNDRAATLASISQGYAIAHGQAVAAQAGIQGDLAKARMAPMIQGLKNQGQQANRQLALLSVGNQPGATNEMDPSVFANNLIPPGAERSKALDEVGKLQQAVKLKQAFIDSYHHINNLTDNGLLSPSDRDSAIAFLAGPLAKLSEGRFNLEESKIQTGALLPGRFESGDTTKNKLPRINQFFDSLVQTPTLTGNNINPKKFKSTNLDVPGSAVNPPGGIVFIKGKHYQVGPDGKSLAAI